MHHHEIYFFCRILFLSYKASYRSFDIWFDSYKTRMVFCKSIYDRVELYFLSYKFSDSERGEEWERESDPTAAETGAAKHELRS